MGKTINIFTFTLIIVLVFSSLAYSQTSPSWGIIQTQYLTTAHYRALKYKSAYEVGYKEGFQEGHKTGAREAIDSIRNEVLEIHRISSQATGIRG